MPAPARSPHLAIYCKLTLVSLFWGGTFIAGRLLALQMPPLPAAVARFAVASALLLVACKAEGGLPRLTLRQALTTLAIGATGVFLYNLCFFAALSRMPAGRTALFVALNPAFTALMLALLGKERLSRRGWFGIAVAFTGAAMVISRGHPLQAFQALHASLGAGEAFMLCAVASWAAYTIIGKHALRGLSPLVTTTYATLWGFALLCLALALTPAQQMFAGNLENLLAITYLGAIGTFVAFIWYYQGVQAIGAARTTIFTNLVPVFGVTLGALLLHETLSPWMLAGGALTITGVVLTNARREPQDHSSRSVTSPARQGT